MNKTPFTRTRLRTAAGAAALLMLAAPLAACGSSSNNDAASASSTGPVTAAATINSLSAGKDTSVKLDAGFASALKTLGLTPSPAGNAKLADGSISFPITGGWAAYFKPGTVTPYVIGQVQHEGSGLNLSAGGTTVTIGNFNVDPGISEVYGDVLVNGKAAASDVPIFDLNGNTLEPLKMDGSDAILTGTEVYVSNTAAGLLNKVFKTDAVTDKLLVGVATITLNTATN